MCTHVSKHGILMNIVFVKYELSNIFKNRRGGHLTICCQLKMTLQLPRWLWCHFLSTNGSTRPKWLHQEMDGNNWIFLLKSYSFIINFHQNAMLGLVEAHRTYCCKERYWLAFPFIQILVGQMTTSNKNGRLPVSCTFTHEWTGLPAHSKVSNSKPTFRTEFWKSSVRPLWDSFLDEGHTLKMAS